ncbi:MAG: M23 family metallopeptidase [Alphaproteobacteria bacterium]|nr:M23 family metallopeptidase [Alphaproteobacteria bacterium]MBV8407143.1 M23 family metallopeptidase [Alphaproteobacteria bacterium]
MKRALRFPSRWAGWWRTLNTTAALSVALGACSTIYPSRQGTIEYPGSGAAPGSPATYIVKDKDTVESVAQRYSVPASTIIDRNNLQKPYTLKPGQALELPGARFVPDSTGGVPTGIIQPAPPPTPVKRENLPPPGQAEAPPRSAAAGQPTPLSPPASETNVTVAATPQHFVWPVKGKVLVPYGATAGGQKSDGIDIQAQTGEPVKAADGGTVVYAGSEVANLGNLVLVQHPGGYITAYGNNEALLVKKGDEVKKGQTIAKAGDSGGAASPRVHFEVRRGGSKTVDPMSVLPPS